MTKVTLGNRAIKSAPTADNKLLMKMTNLKYSFLEISEKIAERQPPLSRAQYLQTVGKLNKASDMVQESFDAYARFLLDEDKRLKRPDDGSSEPGEGYEK